MRVSSFFAVAVAVALVLGPRAALADDPLKPAAKVRFDAGVKLTSAGKYDEAIREFRAAYEIDPEPVLFYSLAVAERLAGRCPAAVDYYRRFLASKPNAERTEAARAGIAMCQPQAAGAPCPPPPRPWYRSPVGVAIAAGVVGVSIGTGYLIGASSTSSSASTAAFSDDFEAQLDRATGQRRIGATFLVVGLALAGGGVAYHYVVERKRPSAGATAFGIAGRSIFLARSF
jgi:tetratricopeptide (TPR) repeat protein